MSTSYVFGIDYGSDSVRAVLVDTQNGEEVSTSVCLYPRWKEGKYCSPSENIFRQHPQDYIDGLESVVKGALAAAPAGAAEQVVGISFDTTGSTPVAVDKEGTPLALKSEFAENPNAMFFLWKDHSSLQEADEINHLAKTWGGEDYTKYVGGIYSSEWFWAKVLHALRIDEGVRAAAYSWVEHCDWMPALLTGTTAPNILKRGRCSAGHKALWHKSWNGLPSEDFLVKLDPLLAGLRDRLYSETFTSDVAAGQLTHEWAERLGLPSGLPVGVGAFDCHMGAVGAVVKPGTLTRVMGTSTCDIAIVDESEIGDKLIPGICGQVDGSVTPGYIGLEAGQSAFGDLYAWFQKLVNWPVENILPSLEGLSEEQKQTVKEGIAQQTLKALSEQAQAIPAGRQSIVALDWVNGRRTPDANQHLKMAISGLSMGSDAPAVFRALVEATACGSRSIIERFEQEGVAVDNIVAIGGIAKKSDFVMQTCADLWQKSIEVAGSDQCCALGAAMFAAVIAGVHPSLESAQAAMNSGVTKSYHPNADMAETYNKIYAAYLELGQMIEEKTEQA